MSARAGRPRVIGYLRVSTDRQAERGLGLEVQELAVRGWAREQGARLVALCVDGGRSGADDVAHRPGLAEALGHLQAGAAEQLVVYRVDRLARDLVLQEWIRSEIVRGGGQLRSTSPTEDHYLREDPDDPSGQLVRRILGAVAEYERAMIRLRMAAGKARKRAAGGYWTGQPPYGWRAAGGQLVPHLEEQRALVLMRAHRRRGRSLRQIAAALAERDIPTRRGSKWTPSGVSSALNNKLARIPASPRAESGVSEYDNGAVVTGGALAEV